MKKIGEVCDCLRFARFRGARKPVSRYGRFAAESSKPRGELNRRLRPALRAMTALVVLREKLIRPLLAASQQPEPHAKPNHPTPSITTTNICGLACETYLPRWG